MYLCFIYYTVNVNYFRDLFESITDYRKIVLLTFLNKNDNDFIRECGFLKGDNNYLSLEFKNIFIQQKDE